MTKLNSSDIIPIYKWFPDIKLNNFYIAGPCSAESEKQIFDTAKLLSEFGIKLFRAGLWKPRTRPDGFEGVGEDGLKWLRDISSEFNMKVSTEVAQSKHIELALKYKIDFLWIGARTTANPFAVQELAESLKGVDVPILIKNPINPDLNLWIGAIERLFNAGIRKIGVIHRGFSAFEKTVYRNNPQWQIPIELKRLLPGISIIGDPSHICGNTSLIHSVSQTALDLNYDGLMIESHICPSEALSDANQQLTPSELNYLINSLIIRNKSFETQTIESLIETLRNEIDRIDEELLGTLQKRFEIVKLIGKYKKDFNVSVLQEKRWETIILNRTNSAFEKGIDKEFILKLLRLIHQESINTQNKIINL